MPDEPAAEAAPLVPRDEVLAAAAWWAVELRERKAVCDSYAFAFHLAEAIELDLADQGAQRWRPDRPDWGSAWRCYGSPDGVPDKVMAAAAEAAGLDPAVLAALPPAVLWIDPGSVAVSEGFCAPRRIAWTAGRPATEARAES